MKQSPASSGCVAPAAAAASASASAGGAPPEGTSFYLPLPARVAGGDWRSAGETASSHSSACSALPELRKVPPFSVLCRWRRPRRRRFAQGSGRRRRSTRTCGTPARARSCRCRRWAASSSTSRRATASRSELLLLVTGMLCSLTCGDTSGCFLWDFLIKISNCFIDFSSVLSGSLYLQSVVLFRRFQVKVSVFPGVIWLQLLHVEFFFAKMF